MAAMMLAGLALLVVAAASEGDLAEMERNTMSEMRTGCKSMLKTVSDGGNSDVELALECRARFSPDICRRRFAKLGPQPWAEDTMEATCGSIVDEIQANVDSMPRELKAETIAELQQGVQKCLAAKKHLSKNPIMVGKKPLKVFVPKFGMLDATFVAKIGASMKQMDLTNQIKKLQTCEKSKAGCPPPPPADPKQPQLGPAAQSVLSNMFKPKDKKSSKTDSKDKAAFKPLGGLVGNLFKQKKFEEFETPMSAGDHGSPSIWFPAAIGVMGAIAGSFATVAVQRVRRTRVTAPMLAGSDEELVQ